MFVKRPHHKKTYMEEQREKQLQVFKAADIQKARNLPGNKESKHQLFKISLLTHLVLSLIPCILQSGISSAGAAGALPEPWVTRASITCLTRAFS